MRTSVQRALLVLLHVAVFAWSSGVGLAQVLNPATHNSESGEYEFSVDPSNPEGKGPSEYRLTHRGEEVWAGERPFSLWQARVSNEGLVCGYAYEGGVDTGGRHGTGYTDLTVFILDAKGQVLLRDPFQDHEGSYRSVGFTGNCPGAYGSWLDDEADRFLVCVPLSSGSSAYAWWLYRPSTATHLGDVPLVAPSIPRGFLYRLVKAKLLPETPLMLIHWYVRSNWDVEIGRSAALELVILDGTKVWQQTWSREYASMRKETLWYLAEPPLDEQLSLNPRGFQFKSMEQASMLNFSVEPDADAPLGWRVTQDSAIPIAELKPSEAETANPESIELEFLGEIALRSTKAKNQSLGRMYDFSIERSGSIAFLRYANREVRFVRVSTDGELLLDIAVKIPKSESGDSSKGAPTGTGRWIIVRNHYSAGKPSEAWWFDPLTGSVKSVPGLLPGHIKKVMGTGDGGFVTLGSTAPGHPVADKLNRYDSNGESLWNGPSDGVSENYSFQSAVWIEGRGAMTLSSNLRKLLESYDLNGARVDSVSVEERLGWEPNNPSGLSPGRNGGFFLHDFGGTPTIIEFDANSEVIGKLSPMYADGRIFRIHGGVQAAPDGTLWTSDSHALLRLRPDGTVDKVIGRGPEDAELEKVRALTVDSHDRIYAVNGRTSAVHVFDRGGAVLKTCLPLPTDFRTAGGLGSITVDGDGAIYYHTGVDVVGDPRYLKLSGNGERIGFETLGFDSTTEDWLFQPGTNRRWVLGYESIGLFDAAGELTATISKRPNGEWIQHTGHGAVGPDGSLAVLIGSKGMMATEDAIGLFGPNGEPIRTIPLADDESYHFIVHDGSTVITQHKKVIRIYRQHSDLPLVFEPPIPEGSSIRGVFRNANADELWILLWSSPTLLRYAWPN